MQAAGVRSLVRELRSRMPHCAAKKKKKEEEEEEEECFPKGETPVHLLNWKLRLSPGHVGLLTPLRPTDMKGRWLG